MPETKNNNQTGSKRNWDILNSAEAFDIICQNRLFLQGEEAHILNLAALRLGNIGDFIATNFFQNLSVKLHADELFLWARIQAVAEGLVFTPDEIGPSLISPKGEKIETYRGQAIFLFRYFANMFLDMVKDNMSGGEAVVEDIKAQVRLAISTADALQKDLKRSAG